MYRKIKKRLTLCKSIVLWWNDPKMCLQETLRFWDYLRIQFRLLILGEGVKWICGFVNIISFRRHCHNLGDPFHLEGLLTFRFLLLLLRAIGFDWTPVSRRGSGRSALNLSNCSALYEIAALFYVIWKISKHAYAINVCLLRTLFVCLFGSVSLFLF